MQWTPLVLTTMPAWAALVSLIKAVVLFVKDFCKAFIMEFKIAYYTEAINGRDLEYPD